MILHDFCVADDYSVLSTPKLDLENIGSDINSKLDRILTKSNWLSNNCGKLAGILASSDDYELNQSLDTKTVETFEKTHGKLPDDYKAVLLAYGWNKFPFYGVRDFIIKPLNLNYTHPIGPNDPLSKTSHAKAPVWYRKDPANALLVSDFGCGIYYCVLLTGPEAGNMWCLDVANTGEAHPIFPLNAEIERVKTVDWLEYWLDLEISTFKTIGILS